GCGASREKRYLRLAPQSPVATAPEPNTLLPGSNPAGRPEIAVGSLKPLPTQAPPPLPTLRRTRATSGTLRVTKQPIPISGSSLPCSVPLLYSSSLIEISARLIGGVRVLVSADWCRRPIDAAGLTISVVCFPPAVGLAPQSWWTSWSCPDGEGKNGTIELMEPLDEEISGIVEVVGRVTAKATILCASYVQFKEDNHPFDLGLYNEAVKITQEFPQFFPLGVVEYD
uniref:Replication protein A3 n=1 Tax=Felis catus TaxID=9685 RepID=A0ABI7WGE2_FELCA